MPASVHVATVPAQPKSTSSGWAMTTRIRLTSASSSIVDDATPAPVPGMTVEMAEPGPDGGPRTPRVPTHRDGGVEAGLLVLHAVRDGDRGDGLDVPPAPVQVGVAELAHAQDGAGRAAEGGAPVAVGVVPAADRVREPP